MPWAGGQAVARYVLDHPDTVRGRRVLDLACGSGVVALAAARAGASAVTALDVDPLALVATAVNAAAHGADVATVRADLSGPDPLPAADVVLAGDTFYDRDVTDVVLERLRRCAASGALVLAGDPGRRFLPRDGLEPLARYDVPVPVDLEGMPVRPAGVFRVLPG